jgi:hypothetical protein
MPYLAGSRMPSEEAFFDAAHIPNLSRRNLFPKDCLSPKYAFSPYPEKKPKLFNKYLTLWDDRNILWVLVGLSRMKWEIIRMRSHDAIPRQI